MKWYGYIICCCLIVAGFFCGLNMADVWSRTSGVVGAPTTIETQNDYEIVSKFDCGTLAFETEDYTNYTYTESFGHVNFDGTSGEYVLLVNDTLASDTNFYAGKVESVYTKKFYDTSGEVASTVVLNISIEFFDSNTIVTITMSNDENSYAYLTQYVNYNGFILKICEKGENV